MLPAPPPRGRRTSAEPARRSGADETAALALLDPASFSRFRRSASPTTDANRAVPR